MKIIKISLAAIVALGLGTSSASADELITSLSSGKVTADLRAFYFSGDRENRNDREALAVGGILKYESASYYGFKAGTAFYVSHDILHRNAGSTDRYGTTDTSNVAGNTEMLQSDGSAIETLGEAYIQYDIGKTMLKVGRQRLNTPLANDYYNRFLPNSFEAVVLANKDLPDTTLLGAYVYGWKYKAGNDFEFGPTENQTNPDTGNKDIDEVVMMLGVINKSIPNTKLQAFLYVVPDVANSVYIQADNSKLLEIGEAKVFGAVQYLSQKDTGDALISDFDTYLAGAKLGVKYKGFKFTGMYDTVGDDTIIGSGTSYSSMGWSKFINFTDIQIDGEALNAGADSYGGVLGYDFGNGLKPAIKFVHIEQDAAKQIASTTTGNRRPSSNEWNLDVKYKIDKVSKVRVRLANIDYESNFFTDSGKSGNEFDENNLRIIYDYKFSVGG